MDDKPLPLTAGRITGGSEVSVQEARKKMFRQYEVEKQITMQKKHEKEQKNIQKKLESYKHLDTGKKLGGSKKTIQDARENMLCRCESEKKIEVPKTDEKEQKKMQIMMERYKYLNTGEKLGSGRGDQDATSQTQNMKQLEQNFETAAKINQETVSFKEDRTQIFNEKMRQARAKMQNDHNVLNR